MVFFYSGKEFIFSCDSPLVIRHGSADIAVIKLEPNNRFKFGNETNVASIPRAPGEQPQNGQVVSVTGWGRACEVDGTECSEQTKHPDMLNVSML